MKHCNKCGETKPTTEFSKNAGRRDGLSAYCKECHKAYSAARYAANPDEINAIAAKWKASNRERIKVTNAAWYAANLERNRADKAVWAKKNPERNKANAAAWQKANPEARRINVQNYRARKRVNGGTLSKGLSAKLFKLQRGKCACCHVSIEDGNHMDHIIPVALGGPNEDWNMQLLCGPCNLSKSAKHPIDFMQQRGFLL